VVLRRGRSEVLTATGLRSLLPGTPQRLLEPSATPPQRSGTTNPGGTTTAQATAQATSPTIEWDTWAPGAHPMARLRTLAQWRQHQALQSDPTTQGLWLIAQAAPTTTPALPSPSPLTPSTGSLFDPMDIPREAAHPPSVAETPKLGIYTAVFEGQIAMANPQGQIQISAGQGGFAPITPTVPPTALPASPAFMEKDQVLNKQSLTPGQCPR
jgi:hypothetical protein